MLPQANLKRLEGGGGGVPILLHELRTRRSKGLQSQLGIGGGAAPLQGCCCQLGRVQRRLLPQPQRLLQRSQ